MIRAVLHFAQASDTSGYFPQLAKWHDRNKYRMLFGTLNPMDPRLRAHLEGQGVRCVSCECRGRREYFVGLVRLARFLKRERADILHTHLFDPSVVGLAAGVVAGTPLRVMTRHYSDYHTRIDRSWHVRLDRLCTRLSHGVIAVSRHTAEHMTLREAAPRGKVHVVLNGIDFERLRLSDPGAPARLREELGAERAHVLLMAARIHPEKGYEHLFAAIPEIKRRSDRPCVLLVAGTGLLEPRYRELARSLGIEHEVRFLGYRTDMADLFATADLLVLPSVAEAFGLVLAEALYCGLPVVATRVGGIPEIVDDGVDGVLVPAADPPALAAAVIELLKDPVRRRTLASAGRNKIAGRFSFETMVSSYEALYERLLLKRPV